MADRLTRAPFQLAYGADRLMSSMTPRHRLIATASIMMVIACGDGVEIDGEDDSDSTYVPADWYVEATICWRSRGPRV